jgi:perosamine synthetase
LVAGVQPGDEVIIPALTFIATANAVSYCGAVPHFVDSQHATLGLDPVALAAHLARVIGAGGVNKETGRRIAAIVPVHIFGHPVDMDALLPVAEKYGIPVVEDAAESLGSLYKGRKAGSMGVISAVSFNGNKIVTTGGGGAVVTSDKAMAERAKHLSTTARVPHQWSFMHDEVGYNYRMPNINAALGCAQLERLDAFVEAKRALAESYRDALKELNSVTFVAEPEGTRSNYWLNAVMLADGQARDATLTALHGAGFMCRPVWTLMHRMKMYAHCPRMSLPVAEDIEARLINLPSSAKWGMRDAA